jgi:hypothetical protein
MTFDWAAQQVRLSVFSTAPIAASERDWQAITGQEEAETRTSIPGGRAFSGAFADGYLSFSYSGQRLDIVLSALEPTEKTEQTLPAIGPWPAVSDNFRAVAEKLLASTHFSVVRLAFGAVLLFPTKSREEAYKYLDDLLVSVSVDPGGMKELLFRVNWEKESSTCKDLMLNRITNWSAVRLVRNLMQLTGGQFAVSADSELQGVRLEIDNSTDHTNTRPFEKTEIVPIFRELLTMARENAEKGERP